MAQTLMAQSPGLARTTVMVPTGHFMHYIHPGWLELPLARTIFEPLKFSYCIHFFLFLQSKYILTHTSKAKCLMSII